MLERWRVAVLPGDGIGPEVTAQAVRVLEAVAAHRGVALEVREGLIGGAAYDAVGRSLPDETLDLCRASDAVFLGAVGGPKWDGLPADKRPEAALLGLRKALGLYANLRPVTPFDALLPASPLKSAYLAGANVLIVRELTGGLYFGEKRRTRTPEGEEEAVDTLVYRASEIERVVRRAFELARGRRKKVTSVDKANVLESSRLWREVATRVAAEYPDVELEHLLVDAFSMELILNPRRFDVVVTENLFGDILSDEAAVLTGSIGMLPSASLADGRFGL